MYACSIFPLGLRPPAEGAAKWDSTACQMLLPERNKKQDHCYDQTTNALDETQESGLP